jgi:hypothetical protein
MAQHKASTCAVEVALARVPNPPRVCLVDASGVVGARFGDEVYNILLSLGAMPLVKALHAFVAAMLPILAPRLRATFVRLWQQAPAGAATAGRGNPPPAPDLVVSFVPQLNAVMADALRPLGVPLITVLTDFSHTPDHPWIQHCDQHVVCGTSLAFEQCAKIMPTARRTRTSGMVVHPRFYNAEISADTIRNTRLGLGLDPDILTALLLFGANPPTTLVKQIVAGFSARRGESAVNLIIICGKNDNLRRELTSDLLKSGAARVDRDVRKALVMETSPGLQARVGSTWSPNSTLSAATGDCCQSDDCFTDDVLEQSRPCLGKPLIDDDFTSSTAPTDAFAVSTTSEENWFQNEEKPKVSCHTPPRIFITGFTRDVALFMRIADFLVGKPGPGVVSEALVSRLPCVLYVGSGASDVMAQERDVMEWVLQSGVGIAAKTAAEAAAVSREDVNRMRKAIEQQPRNIAVYEVTKIITDTLSSRFSSGETIQECPQVTRCSSSPDAMCADQTRGQSSCDAQEIPSSGANVKLTTDANGQFMNGTSGFRASSHATSSNSADDQDPRRVENRTSAAHGSGNTQVRNVWDMGGKLVPAS